MAVIAATFTNAAMSKLPRMWGGLLAFSGLSYFKIAEGGWVDVGAGRTPRTPDATLLDMDALVNPSRYPTDSRASFTKVLAPGDFSFIAPNTVQVTCLLDFGDFNDDGYGNSPEVYEIGVFDSDNDLMLYGTFAKQTKNPAVQLQNLVRATFGG